MNAYRQIKLIEDGDGQTVHIPADLKLPAGDAIIRRDGNRLTIEVPQKSNKALIEYLRTLEPLDEDFPDIPRGPARDVDL